MRGIPNAKLWEPGGGVNAERSRLGEQYIDATTGYILVKKTLK
jgi:hypothetical protein